MELVDADVVGEAVDDSCGAGDAFCCEVLEAIDLGDGRDVGLRLRMGDVVEYGQRSEEGE